MSSKGPEALRVGVTLALETQMASSASSRKGSIGLSIITDPVDMASFTACPKPSAADIQIQRPHSWSRSS
jgi:hypothetical protein